MKFKRLISGLIAAAVAVSTVTFSSFTTFAEDGKKVSGTCGENATWFINSDDILVISGTGKVDSYSGWNTYRESIKEVVIEEGITSTESSLFTFCKNVEKIVFPSSLEELGYCLSSELSSLTDVWIFSKTLENKFSGSSGLYPQPGSITKWHVYEGSTTEASFRAGLKCTDDDFEYITENDSFPEITNREPLVLAAETETSGPAGIKSSWSWDAATKTLTFSGSGLLTIKNGFKKYASVVETIDMGDSEITGICEGAFGVSERGSTAVLCPKLKHVTFPSTLKVIGKYAFNNAPIEENLNLPEGLTSIDFMAFYNSKITGDLKLPSTIQYIGQQAFANTPITSVNLTSGTKVVTAAFGGCNLLKEVTIPAGLVYIKGDGYNRPAENQSFANCISLERVIILGGGTLAYDNKNSENGLPQDMFRECTSLKEVVIVSKELDSVCAATALDATFPTNEGMKFKVYKDSLTERTLKNAGYLTNDNIVYLADTTELEKAIADGEAVDAAMYTDDSVKALTDAITAAKAVMENIDATQDDIDNALKTITDANKALVYKPADYSAVEAAKAKVPEDLSVYTDVTAKAVTDAVAAVVEGKNISEQATVDAWAKAIEDAVAGLEIKPTGGNVSGTIFVSDKNAETEMTVKAVASDGTETTVTATSMGTYTLEDLAVGEYTLTISGGKYVERTYEITVEAGELTQDVELNPYGDINGDGKVTTADVGMANSHAKGVKVLEEYKFDCADVKTDGNVTTADVGMINSHAKSVKTLW